MSTSILIADDQALVPAGFRMILEVAGGLRVVAEACHGSDAIDAGLALHPDVVLMDIRMPKTDGLEATHRILAAAGPTPRVLMLTTFDRDEYVSDALKAGASGSLLKDVPAEQLVAGVRTVGAGDALLSPTVTRRLIGTFVRDRPLPAALPPGPTEREVDVLRLLAHGMSNGEIAHALVVPPATVRTRATHIVGKLGLRDRVQAVVLADEAGIAAPRGPAPRGRAV